MHVYDGPLRALHLSCSCRIAEIISSSALLGLVSKLWDPCLEGNKVDRSSHRFLSLGPMPNFSDRSLNSISRDRFQRTNACEYSGPEPSEFPNRKKNRGLRKKRWPPLENSRTPLNSAQELALFAQKVGRLLGK